MPRSNPGPGTPKLRHFFKIGVMMITNMLSNHKPMTKIQHFAGIGQQSNNLTSKPLFKRLVSTCICNVKVFNQTQHFVLSAEFILKLQVQPRWGYAITVVDWPLDTSGNPRGMPDESTNSPSSPTTWSNATNAVSPDTGQSYKSSGN